MNKERYRTSAAQGSAELRRALKERWPNIKFKVISDTYSMGDSINVTYNFGPPLKEVEAIVNRWQDGHFDGMQDMYISGSGSKYTYADGSVISVTDVKYTFTKRAYHNAEDGDSYTETGKIDAEKLLCAHFKREHKGHDTNLFGDAWDGHHSTAGTWAFQTLGYTSFPSDKIKLTGITHVHDDNVCYDKSFVYQYEDLAPVKTAATVASMPATQPTTGIELLTYSERAVVITGDTRPIKDILAQHNGRFNKYLKHPSTGVQMTGWIFPATKEDQLRQALSI